MLTCKKTFLLLYYLTLYSLVSHKCLKVYTVVKQLWSKSCVRTCTWSVYVHTPTQFTHTYTRQRGWWGLFSTRKSMQTRMKQKHCWTLYLILAHICKYTYIYICLNMDLNCVPPLIWIHMQFINNGSSVEIMNIWPVMCRLPPAPAFDQPPHLSCTVS